MKFFLFAFVIMILFISPFSALATLDADLEKEIRKVEDEKRQKEKETKQKEKEARQELQRLKKQEKLKIECQKMLDKARLQHNQINRWHRKQKKSVVKKKTRVRNPTPKGGGLKKP
jgi:hypothetical protein